MFGKREGLGVLWALKRSRIYYMRASFRLGKIGKIVDLSPTVKVGNTEEINEQFF